MRAAELFDQVAHRETGPRHRHRPCFDAAKAVKAFLERQRAHEFVDIEDARFFNETGHVDLPRRRFQSRGLLVNTAFENTEFVEIIIRSRVNLFGGRAIENETGVMARWIKIKRGRLFLGAYNRCILAGPQAQFAPAAKPTPKRPAALRS